MKSIKRPRQLSNGLYVCPDCYLSYPTMYEAQTCCAVLSLDGDAKPAQTPDQHQVGGDHYTKQAIQPWDIIDTWPQAERIAYYRGNVLKYMMRLNDKDSPAMNARKAEHYCAKLASTIEGASNG